MSMIVIKIVTMAEIIILKKLLAIATIFFNILTFGTGVSIAGVFFQVLKELFTGLWC